jgi:hypothetical protein
LVYNKYIKYVGCKIIQEENFMGNLGIDRRIILHGHSKYTVKMETGMMRIWK